MNKTFVSFLSPVVLKAYLHDTKEIALLDVREYGQYGEGHLFYAVNTPYSKLEDEVLRLAPRKNVRMVLLGDENDILSIKAHKRLTEIGYTNVHILKGGIPAWKHAGYEVFAGVNLPSKTFGELVEHVFNTPKITAAELNEKILNKEDMVILDGRPFQEFKKMSIPTAMCCPNGELALRIDDIVHTPDTTIVVNCAGRTRSIIGAQTLINLGLPNKIYALENGTQGWFLADLALDNGKTNTHALTVNEKELSLRRERAHLLARKHHVPFVNSETVEAWLKQQDRSTFLCDVRTIEEFSQYSLPGAQHTPGGQLVQATDQFIGVRGARLVLFDQEGVRAPAVASWLAMLGWDVAVWIGALEHAWTTEHTLAQQAIPATDLIENQHIDVQNISSEEILQYLQRKPDDVSILDMRSSMKYRDGHIKNSIWTTRSQLDTHKEHINDRVIIAIADDECTVKCAAKELREWGAKRIWVNLDSPIQWTQAKLTVEITPELPPNEECIDYLFFVHDRHDGNKVAAREYLAWETNLLSQIDEQEKSAFKLPKVIG